MESDTKTKCSHLLQKCVLALVWLVSAPLTYASTPYAGGALLEIVSQMAEGTWRKVNANSYSEVWAPAELRPLNLSSNPTPDRIIRAWSSFAWDSNRGNLIIYGGGHANYSGNDVYRWRSENLRWERASLPSEIMWLSSVVTIPVDGADAAPSSAHTYDNAVFLPIADRYLNFGGAIYNTGGPYVRPSENNPSVMRQTGPYLFDPARADPNKVGGTTGSHVQRVGTFPEIEGGEMWENRDFPSLFPDNAYPKSHINGCTAYSQEAEHDVVYVAARPTSGGTSPSLYKYQVIDINSPELDQIERVGIHWTGPSGKTTCGYDPVGKIFLRIGDNTRPFVFWDLRPDRSTDRNQIVEVTGSIAEFVEWVSSFNSTTGLSLQDCALDFDPNRGNFLLWCGSAEVWRITPPEQLSTAGWQIQMEPLGSGESPPLNVGTGILGKWEYIPGFDVFIGLEDAINGNIWVYKPIGWVEPEAGGNNGGGGGPGPDPDPGPGPVNHPPVVILNAPVTGETVAVDSLVTLSAQASDTDGSVVEVIFHVNGSAVGSVTAEPYLIDWPASEAGEYTITAEAIDDMGASAHSEPVILIVQSDTSPPPAGEVVTTRIYRDGGANDAAVIDTYLSDYHKNSNFGNAQNLLFLGGKYTPLIKFNVFASEGGPVPDNAIIKTAVLHLHKGAYSNVVALHAMLKPWKEGETTWFRASNDQDWEVAGAGGVGLDYDATADEVVNMEWNAGWVAFDVTNRLKAFTEGKPNYGWRLVHVSGPVQNVIRFNSSEQALEMDVRPQLEVTWRVNEGGGGPDPDPDPDPGPVNHPPVVILNAPVTGETVAVDSLVTLSAQASDIDGSVVEVIFHVNGSAVGSVTAEPYLIDWPAAEAGEYTITAEAIDDMGASVHSEPAILIVQSDTLPPPAGEVVTTRIYRDGGANDAAVIDTYLSDYHKNSNFGNAQNLLFLGGKYAPLIKFNVFASEGGPVPDNAVIKTAVLHLHKGAYSNVVALHAMLKPWKEGEATWFRASNDLDWEVAGAGGVGLDYDATADAMVNMEWNAGWVAFNVTNRLKAFTEGEPNYGWRLVHVSGPVQNVIRFNSSEQALEMDVRPQLEVTWRMQ